MVSKAAEKTSYSEVIKGIEAVTRYLEHSEYTDKKVLKSSQTKQTRITDFL